MADIRGDLHVHTHETDGRATLEEMAEAARQRGLKYLAITDHSNACPWPEGSTRNDCCAQWAKIDKLNAALDDFVLLKGIECDILERGGMDLPDDVLAQADWVNRQHPLRAEAIRGSRSPNGFCRPSRTRTSRRSHTPRGD